MFSSLSLEIGEDPIDLNHRGDTKWEQSLPINEGTTRKGEEGGRERESYKTGARRPGNKQRFYSDTV